MLQTHNTILVGSTVYGKTDIGCKVLEIDGDTLTIETVSGERQIPFSRVIKVDPPPLTDRLGIISTLDKPEAIEVLNNLLLEFSTNSIYEASLDLQAFPGTFIRRMLAEINPTEFDAIGVDGSEGKYGISTLPDLQPVTEDSGTGSRVTHLDLYHRYGSDIGTIELIDGSGECRVKWDSDGHIGRYSIDSLKWERSNI